MLEQHKDLAAAPPSPTLVKLKVRLPCGVADVGGGFVRRARLAMIQSTRLAF